MTELSVPVFIMTWVVARLTFFLKPVAEGVSIKAGIARRQGWAADLPTTWCRPLAVHGVIRSEVERRSRWMRLVQSKRVIGDLGYLYSQYGSTSEEEVRPPYSYLRHRLVRRRGSDEERQAMEFIRKDSGPLSIHP